MSPGCRPAAGTTEAHPRIAAIYPAPPWNCCRAEPTLGCDHQAEHGLGSTKRSASTHGVDLLQLQAGIAGQFSCAEQQSVDDIRAELLLCTALLAGGFGGVQHLHECIQAS